MPGAGAEVARIEDADAVLYCGTALIEDVVYNILSSLRRCDRCRAVVAVVYQKLSDAAVAAVYIGISDALCDKSHALKALAARLAHQDALGDISVVIAEIYHTACVGIVGVVDGHQEFR